MFDITHGSVGAMTKAWTVTIIAVLLLIAALAVSQVWDGGAYLQALQDTLAFEQSP